MKIKYFILTLLILLNFLSAQNPLRVYSIDVNQGSSTLIISPTNKSVLIDAGDSNGNYGDTVLSFLTNLGLTHLNYTIATHYHSDHIGGMPRVIYGLSGPNRNDSILNHCYDRGDSSVTVNTTYNNYLAAVGSKRLVIGLGDTIDLGAGAYIFTVVRNAKTSRSDSVVASDENDRSIGLVLQYGFFKLNINGDLGGYNDGGYRDLETKIAPIVKKTEVLIVNHHGSRYSTNNIFLDSLRPQVAIISQGMVPNNYGFPKQLVINRLIAHNTYIYQLNVNVDSGGTFLIPDSGRILNTTAAITVNNHEYYINGDTYLIRGVRRDGTVVEIITPKDTVAEGTNIIPRAKIKNLGNTTDQFRVRMMIGSSYNKTKTVTNLAPNDTISISFDTVLTALRGNYSVICSTEVARDSNIANNRKTVNLTVSFFDSELSSIHEPVANDTFFTTQTIYPQVVIKDNSAYTYPSTVKTYFQITGNNLIYYDSIQKICAPNQIDTILFTSKHLHGITPGIYRCSSWVNRDVDLVPSNNSRIHNIVILQSDQQGWTRIYNTTIPYSIKDGGALTATENKIYAFIGNNQPLFYCYHPDSTLWQNRKNIGYGYHNGALKSKYVKKGSALTFGQDNFGRHVIYALKGNNTYEFWKYLIAQDSWSQQDDIRDFAFKDGSAIAYYTSSSNNRYVYTLWGNNKYFLFRAFDVINNQWLAKDTAPLGRDRKKFKDGSCMVRVRDTIYALKGGAKYNEFYAYDIINDNWIELESIPQSHPDIRKKKKIKSGGAITYDENSNCLYAFKGGGTHEFWCYELDNHIWLAKETIPKYLNKKSIVKAGASLTALDGIIYAIKGNNTTEFWRYIPPDNAKTNTICNNLSSQLTPQSVNLNNDLPIIAKKVEIFNINGQKIIIDNIFDIKLIYNYNLQPGIYFVSIDTQEQNGQKIIRKIVIPR